MDEQLSGFFFLYLFEVSFCRRHFVHCKKEKKETGETEPKVISKTGAGEHLRSAIIRLFLPLYFFLPQTLRLL